jgi:DNA-binding NarL/FixJ family response regulator
LFSSLFIVVGGAISETKIKALHAMNHRVTSCAENPVTLTAMVKVTGPGSSPQPQIVMARAEFLANLTADQRLQLSLWATLAAVGEGDSAGVEMLKLGCRGIIDPGASVSRFNAAVRALVEGELWASRRVLVALVEEFISTIGNPRFTVRQNAVVRLVRDGCTNHEIASRLGITRETVRWYLREIGGRVGAPLRQKEDKNTTVVG